MENVNLHMQFQHQPPMSGLSSELRSELIVDDPPDNAGLEVSHKVVSSRATRRRTKTGCLTCRQRRIKCGEEKPICNNCTKSKRECKGYAQRLVFKNPLGIPGNRTAFPAFNEQAQALQIPRKLDGKLDAARGPILAPKLPVTSVLEPKCSPTYSGLYKESQKAITDASSNPTTTAQSSLLWNSESCLPSEPTTLFDQLPQDSSSKFSADSHHDVEGEIGSNKQEDNNWVTQESTLDSTYLPDTYSPSHALQSAHASSQAVFPSSSYEEHQRDYVWRRSMPLISSPDAAYFDEDDDDYYDVETDDEAEDQVSLQNFNQLSLIMASASRDEQRVRSFTTYLNEPNILASYQPTFGSSPLNNPKTARIFLHFINSTGPSLSIFERHPIDPSTMLGTPVPMAQQGLWTYTLPLMAFEHQALLQAILAISSLHISFLQQASPTVSLKHYQYALKRVGKAVGLPIRRKQVGTLAATLLLAYYEVMTADHTKWGSHLAGSALLVREIDYAGITRDLRAQRRNRWLPPEQTGKLSRSFADDYNFNNSFNNDDPFAELEGGVDEAVVGYLAGRAINYDEFGQVESGRVRSSNKLTRKDIERFRIQCDMFWWFCKQDFIQSIISGGPLFLPFSQWTQCPPRAGLNRLDAIYGSGDHISLLMGRLADFGYRDRKRKLREAKLTGIDWKPDARFMKFMARFSRLRSETQSGPPPSSTHIETLLNTSPPNDSSERSSQSNIDSRKGSQTSQGTYPEARQSPITTPSPGSRASPMYGMVPAGGPRQPPASFTAATHPGVDPYSQDEEEESISSYDGAENEWESMLAAFEVFGHTLGPEFMPLPSDSVLPISSPFGPALQYRTHNIGALWALYYTGRILLHRLHPSMPPAMMVAAGVAAPTTAEYAQIIGKITAGIYCPQFFHSVTDGLSPTLGSCLVEISVPIFFAAVQYMDAAQRSWIINTLSEISRLTGWKSSDAIAKGCERAWITAAEQGRGPPYQRPSDGGTQQTPGWTWHEATEEVDDRFNENSERRFVTVKKPPFLSWAMGILSLDDHLQ